MAAEHEHKSIEWLPWSELNSSQRIARLGIYVAFALILFAAARGLVGMIHPGERSSSATQAFVPEETVATLTDAERKTGVETLCKVFQIYRIPKSNDDADAAAKNAAELFKLQGDPSPQRSSQILRVVARQFASGDLTAADCAAAGQPLPTQATRPQ